jgi:ribonuclease HII
MTSKTKTLRIHNLLSLEKTLWSQNIKYVAGVDEAGRGPIAGPVVAAAVIFPQNIYIPGIDDSKKLSFKTREALYKTITTNAISYKLGVIREKIIDDINILQATYKAMQIAITRLPVKTQHILVDGRENPYFTTNQTAIVGGDRQCFSIAAASILAKVIRDRIMISYNKIYPQYDFAQHKGYPTAQHIEAIKQHGFCPLHRKSFHVKELQHEK